MANDFNILDGSDAGTTFPSKAPDVQTFTTAGGTYPRERTPEVVRRLRVVLLASLALLSSVAVQDAASSPREVVKAKRAVSEGNGKAGLVIAGRYIVTEGGRRSARSLSAAAARSLAARGALVEEDSIVTADNHGSWGLDRIDQRDGESLDSTYDYDYDGTGVHAYILDSGIRGTHNEFTGRIGSGANFTGLSGGSTTDCAGHGTHVAGTVGGTTDGVAKNVTLHSVRVLNCSGSGASSDTAAGIDWVIDNHIEPAVLNISINSTSTSVRNAVEDAIDAGIVVVMSGGNDGINSCSSSRVNNQVPEVLNVGNATSSDTKSSSSNYGSCIDVWAPGNLIVSAGISSDSSTATKSGTSMAAPHVSGVAALYLDQFGDAGMEEVHDAIIDAATTGELQNLGTGSPDRMLYSFFPGAPTTTTTVPPTTTTTAPTGGTVFFDNFETDQGWTVNPDGTDTATSGQWERGVAESTFDGVGYKQLTAYSGTHDLVTGRLAGGDCCGDYDVDGGESSVRSPAIALPSSGTLTLSYRYYMAHGSNSSSSDYLRLYVVDAAGETRLFNGLGDNVHDDAAWATRSYDLGDWAGETVRILIRVADVSGSSLVEAAYDDVLIEQT